MRSIGLKPLSDFANHVVQRTANKSVAGRSARPAGPHTVSQSTASAREHEAAPVSAHELPSADGRASAPAIARELPVDVASEVATASAHQARPLAIDSIADLVSRASTQHNAGAPSMLIAGERWVLQFRREIKADPSKTHEVPQMQTMTITARPEHAINLLVSAKLTPVLHGLARLPNTLLPDAQRERILNAIIESKRSTS